MTRYYDKMLKEVLLEKMKTSPLDDITVLSLTKTAGINRKTFYNHYQDLPDLICHIISDHLEQIITVKASPANWDQITRSIMTSIQQNQSFLYAVFHSGYAAEVQQSLQKKMDEYCIQFVDSAVAQINASTARKVTIEEPYRSYLAMFYSSLMFAMLSKWFTGGMKESIEDIIQLIAELTGGNVYSGILKYSHS